MTRKFLWTIFRSIKHEVERRVVAQLALAHETEQLTRGSEVRISVIRPEKSQLQEDDDEIVDELEPKLRISIKKPDQESFVDLVETISAGNASLFS